MADEKKVVELWGIDWGMEVGDEGQKGVPKLHRGAAVEGPKGYTAVGDRIAVENSGAARAAFGYRTRITKGERTELLVGLTPKEAIDLAFTRLVSEKTAAQQRINAIERRMTELMMLELQVEKGE